MVDQAQVEKLKKATSTSKLLKYLEKELDWPIETDELEDNFFEYDPEELQFKSDLAAKIKSIRRLRKPASNIEMPWGIFFIEFSTKNLPLVALRRILNQFVEKKRQSKDLKSWEMGDLLFVSNYGVDEQRKISLCLFNEDKEKSSLPRLKVIEWSDQDNPNALEKRVNLLKENLEWPDDDLSTEDWQAQWQLAFTSEYRSVIKTSKVLAQKLAELAKDVRITIQEALDIENKNGYLHQQLEEFRKVLIHDLNEATFADMYAQTIAYGLLTAEITNPIMNEADHIGQIAITNPFLKELLESFLEPKDQQGVSHSLNFDELGISGIKKLLSNSDMPSIVRDFGAKNPQEDPVIHFYELFLKEYDAKEKVKRGVFYTPRPVVSFIVRSVDETLRKEFELEDGLADITTWAEMVANNNQLEIPDGATPESPFVQILDPATGTGTFLVEVIDIIHQTMTAKWRTKGYRKSEIRQLWNDYVPNHLLPRLHGYELMMAPYAIAHMKIGIKLYETGYRFESDERALIFLTHSLEPPQNFSGMFDFASPILAHEAKAVNSIKRYQRFTVVIGNPPYAKLSANLEVNHRKIIDAYRFVAGERIVERGALALEMNLQDDYVKFIRFSQMLLEETGVGVIGLISNHGYLDTPTLRGMRYSLHQFFNKIQILDLHGHSGKGEKSPDGSVDENVFDIKQGVAIGIFSLSPRRASQLLMHSEMYGTRAGKYVQLLESVISEIERKKYSITGELYKFIPEDLKLLGEYKKWLKVSDMFRLTSDGIVTARDSLVIAFSEAELLDKIVCFRDWSGSGLDACEGMGISSRSVGFNPDRAIQVLQSEDDLTQYIVKIQYRPFDYRYLFYHKEFIQSMRRPVMSQLLIEGNILLAVTRQVNRPKYEHAFVSHNILEKKTVSHDRNTQTFPIFIYPTDDYSLFDKEIYGNWSQEFSNQWDEITGINPLDTINALQPLNYIYGVLHSPTYRSRYFPLLKSDFPRIPFTKDRDLLDSLELFGSKLISLHTVSSSILNEYITTKIQSGPMRVEKISYSDGIVWIDKEKLSGFKGVTEEIWNFYIGGYQVCHKWLKDRQEKGGKNPRPGRVLTDSDIDHYQKIIVAISETIRIMGEIDEVIEEHGGWPDAFSTND